MKLAILNTLLLVAGLAGGMVGAAAGAADAGNATAAGNATGGIPSIPLEVLVLTSPGFAGPAFFEAVLQGYGAHFTVLAVAASTTRRPDWAALLYQPGGGAPRFGGVFMYPDLEASGALNRAEVEALWAYKRAFGVRTVVFGAWPTNFGFLPDYSACGSDDVAMNFTAAAGPALAAAGLNPSASLASGGLYRCPGDAAAAPLPTCSMWAADFASSGLHTPCTPTPVLAFSVTGDVAGALVSYADGREALAFMPACNAWSTACIALAHMSLLWMLRGVVPGERRALLTVQVDDTLLNNYFDAPTPDGVTGYRLSVGDLRAHALWQAKLRARLPAGSDIRLELPFCGGGVQAGLPPLRVDDRGCHDMPAYAALGCSCWDKDEASCPATASEYCRDCRKEWAKPVGTGEDRMYAGAANMSALWNATLMHSGDRLAAALMDNTNGLADAFFFCHHTFTHENLDNATRYDADAQIGLNQDMAGPAFLRLSTRAGWSSSCMVTPQISGLRNGDALAALAACGVTCAAGDNTWPFLLNPDNPHHMLYTTEADNGFDGFAILPRFATEIYFNCSTPDQNLAIYNNMYAAYYGGPSTIDQLLQREATRVVRDGLLKLRKDPHMMHQANLAILDASGKSLLMRWVDAVLAEFGRYTTWPVASLKMDDLMAAFQAREARDACRLSYAAELGVNGTVSAVTVSSAAAATDAGVPAAGCVGLVLLPGAAAALAVPVPAGGSARAAVANGPAWPFAVAAP